MSHPQRHGFDLPAAQALLDEVFAPWVKDLQLTVEHLLPPDSEGGAGAVLRMKFSQRLCREGGIICGQALMSLADTAMVFAVAAAAGGYRPMTTVDQTTHFLKPAANSDVLADARIVRIGKSMAFGRVMLTSAGDSKPVPWWRVPMRSYNDQSGRSGNRWRPSAPSGRGSTRFTAAASSVA